MRSQRGSSSDCILNILNPTQIARIQGPISPDTYVPSRPGANAFTAFVVGKSRECFALSLARKPCCRQCRPLHFETTVNTSDSSTQSFQCHALENPVEDPNMCTPSTVLLCIAPCVRAHAKSPEESALILYLVLLYTCDMYVTRGTDVR